MSDEFVRRDVLDLHMQRIEAVIALNLEAQKSFNERLEGKIDAVNERLEAKIDAVNERLETKFDALREHVEDRIDVLCERMDRNLAQYDALANDIKGDIRTLSARLDTQQTKFGWYLTIFGIVITVVIAAIQFWK